MSTLQEQMTEYKKQLKKGMVQKAYKGLMDYIMTLRTHFKNKYPDYSVSGIYFGYMDMTYFAITPRSLTDRKLKIAVVFVHENCRFEVWLAGQNKQVQKQYWQLFKETGWNKYYLVSTTRSADAILEHILVEDPDFSSPDILTKQIEQGLLTFIMDIDRYLTSNYK